MVGKRLVNTGGAVAAFDPLANFEVVTYTGNSTNNQKITGYIRKGAAFNGSDSKIATNITNSTIPVNSDFSISGWINISSTGGFIFGEGSWNAWSTAGFGAQVLSSNRLEVSFANNGSSGGQQTTTSALSLNTWYHVVVTIDIGNALKIYINGNEDGTTSLNTNFRNNVSGGFYIGSEGTPDYEFNGKIDQVRFFNKALSSSEVTTLYGETYASATKSTTDIFNDSSGVALYELDEDANDTGRGTIDSGQSAVFNGSSSDIRIPTGTASTGGDLTISMWLNPNSLGTQILADWGFTSSGNGLQIYFSSSALHFRVKEGGSTVFSHSATSPTTNTWQHLAFVWNNSAGGLSKIYINGVEDSSLSSTQSGALTLNTTVPYYIGNYGTSGEILDGKLDDFRIYSSALSSTDVEYITNNDTANIPTNNLRAHYKFDGNGNDETTNYNATTVNNITYSDPAELPVYNGTPTNINFLGMAFQPDFVWIKSRNTGTGTSYHGLWDSVRGTGGHLYSSLANAETNTPNRLYSFDSNGFSLGNGSDPEYIGNNNYVAWCWKAGGTAVSNTDGSITSSVSANTGAGFSIVEWTGTGAINTVGHGLSTAPELILIKDTDSSSDWQVYAEPIGNGNKLSLNSTAAASSTTRWDSTSPTSTVFTLRDIGLEGGLIAYCFHSVDGYQKVGSYAGGSTGSSNEITTGFSPRFILTKSYDNSTESWSIFDSLRTNNGYPAYGIFANTNDAEASGTETRITFTSTGWYWNVTKAGNVSGRNYIYLAIA